MLRGFTLLEAMITVSILGIVAAIALPNMLPEVQKATLEGGAENAATFIARARAEAMTGKRCVRVWVPASATSEIVAERLNNFDCDVAPQTLAGGIGVDGSASVWIEFARLRLDSKQLAAVIAQAPNSSRSGALAPGSAINTPAGFTGDEIRFRPNGRVFSNDAGTVLTNDDAIVAIVHAGLAAGGTKRILVDGNGLICVFARGATPTVDGAAPNFKCP